MPLFCHTAGLVSCQFIGHPCSCFTPLIHLSDIMVMFLYNVLTLVIFLCDNNIHTLWSMYTVWPEILAGNLFWRNGGFESNPPIFHPPKTSQCDVSLLRNHSLCLVSMVLAAAKFASLIVGMEFTVESCVRGHRFSKEFCTPKEKSWLVCQRDEGDSNDVYTVAVKTDGTKTVQIKHSNDLVSFQLHVIIDFVLTERKLAHSNVKFPARSISHFAMNIIMAKTGSTAKVNSAK